MTSPSDAAARDQIHTSFDGTLFVEAGAGTGKTYALVTRVVHMVATGHLASMAQLAAITFTENAAAELRGRIRQGLLEGAEGAHAGVTYDDEQRARCRQGLDNLEDAVLTTLHGFASRILAEAPLEAGLPPGFAVAEGSGGEEADRAWRDFLDDLLDDPGLRDYILHGLTLGLKLYDLRLLADALSASWDRLLDAQLTRVPLPVVSAAPVIAELKVALTDADLWPPGDRLTEHLLTVRQYVDELAGLVHPLDVLDRLVGVKLKTTNGDSSTWAKAGLSKAAVVASLQTAQAIADGIVAAVGAAVTTSLAARIAEWVLDQATQRRDTGALTYHDLLVRARDLLAAEPEVRARLHHTWSTLLIDEFQDTDPLQVEIACLLAGDNADVPPPRWQDISIPGPRLFLVGDAKQSIYRFRRADVDLFSAVGEQHPHAALTVNFRSVPGVLQAVNHAFTQLIGADPDAGISYAALEAFRSTPDAGPPVLLLGGPQAAGSAADLREREAAHLADVVVRAKRDGWRVGVGAEAGTGREASYRDVAILLPTRTSLPALEKALQARSVPYRIESRSLIWSTDAVRGIIAILAAVDNPADEVALLAALRNPGFGCSDADLLAWRAAGGRWSLFGGGPDRVPADLTPNHPVAAALAVLHRWHDQRWWLPVNELVDCVVRELRLVELTAAQRRPRDHWRRLRFVVDQARAWCDAGGSGLGGFVTWALRQMDDDADVLETVVPEPDDDAVRILTVHGSKGLEFPITMVAGLAGGLGPTPKVIWTDGGLEIRLKSGALETPGWGPAQRDDTEQARRESIRLLYVALTRAMDHLVLGCYHVPPKGKSSKLTHAQRLWELLASSEFAVPEIAGPDPDAFEDPMAPVADHRPVPNREAFLVERAELLAAVVRRTATSPTAQVAEVGTAAVELDADDPGNEPEKPAAETHFKVSTGDSNGAVGAPGQSRIARSSRRGAAIGTATHRVLELANLAQPGTEEVRRLARMACASAQIPELVADVESRVWSVLRSEPMRAIAAGARAHSEVYLVAPDDERFVEGYIDLLLQQADGTLEIWDYKTDHAATPAELAAKQTRYAPQLAAYAGAAETVLRRGPAVTGLIFARAEASQYGSTVREG